MIEMVWRMSRNLSWCGLLLMVLGFSIAVVAQNEQVVPEIRITAKQFKFEPQTITIQQGQHVKLLITSADVDHGFQIDELGINQRIPAGKTVVIDLTPQFAGKFEFHCSVYCGSGHEDMMGELVVEDTQSNQVAVTFDERNPGVAVVEINGQRIRVDTAAKTWSRLEEPSKAPAAAQPSPTKAAEAKPQTVSEPYDYRLVNVPTPKRVVRHSLNLYFTHRFSEPIKPLDQSAKDLLGLDSFSASSFGLFYGVTDKLYVSVYRSPICQRGLCRTIEVGAGYHWLDEGHHSPVALSTYVSVEGDRNFSQNFTYNAQLMAARSVSRFVNLFFSPAVHFNANGQRRFDPKATDFFPPAAVADSFRQPRNSGSFGFGVNGRIRPTVSLLFEYTPRVGFKLGEVIPIFSADFRSVTGFRAKSEAEIGFGVEKDVGRHTFSLTFSNTHTTTTSRYNSSNLVLPPSKFVIGFNLYRRLLK